MMGETDYYDAGIKSGREFERRRLLEWLERKRQANATVVRINEIVKYLKKEEDDGRAEA